RKRHPILPLSNWSCASDLLVQVERIMRGLSTVSQSRPTKIIELCSCEQKLERLDPCNCSPLEQRITDGLQRNTARNLDLSIRSLTVWNVVREADLKILKHHLQISQSLRPI